MDAERIDDNTIKVYLEQKDLEERGVSILDLIGKREKIESFFYSILDEVDTDKTFSGNDAITFQVMPETDSSGLVLIINKEDTNSESGYSPQKAEDTNADDYSEVSYSYDDSSLSETEIEDLFGNVKAEYSIIAEFKQFEDYIQLSQIWNLPKSFAELWKYKDTYYLYLLIPSEQLAGLKLDEVNSLIGEFGKKSKVTYPFLSEHGKKIMDNDAITTTKSYFK